MNAALLHHRFTLEEYFEYELDQPEKFEYAGGAILAMSGASPAHNVVAGNVFAFLHAHYMGRCRVMGSDQRVATPSGLHTYPDGLVVCGPMDLTRFKGTATLHNPRLLLEVLSASTRAYDLGEKRQQYETIPSLRDILLVEPLEPDVRHVHRTADGWELRRYRHLDDVVEIEDLRLPLAAIYRDVPEE